MTKKNFRPIDDADLLAYLEGLASPDVKAAIEASPELLAQARQLAREEARLRLFLTPVEDENGLDLQSASLWERMRVEIARLIRPRGSSSSNRGARAAQPVFVRGMSGEMPELNSQVRKLAFEVGELFIAVEIGLEPDHTAQYHLRGYVLGWEEQEAEAAIWCNNRQLATARLNDEDEFFVEQLLPGEYQIVITTPHRRIALESFSIG